MSAHEIETIKSALDKSIDHGQPEIFKGPPARIHRSREGGAVGADAIRHQRHRKTARRHFVRRALCNGVDNNVIGGEGEMIAMLFGMSNWKQDHFLSFSVGWKKRISLEVGGVRQQSPDGRAYVRVVERKERHGCFRPDQVSDAGEVVRLAGIDHLGGTRPADLGDDVVRARRRQEALLVEGRVAVAGAGRPGQLDLTGHAVSPGTRTRIRRDAPSALFVPGNSTECWLSLTVAGRGWRPEQPSPYGRWPPRGLN